MVTHDFPPQMGGIAAHVFELTKQLIKWNHRVVVLTAKPKKFNNEPPQVEDLEIVYVTERFADRSNSFLLPIKIIDYSIRAHFNLKKTVKQYSIDLVHYHNLVPESLVTKRFDVPIVFTAHESHLVKSAQKNRKRLHCYLSHVDHLIAVSQDRLAIARKYCRQLKSAHYISNGVDINRFNMAGQKTELRQQYNFPANARIVLIVSRLEPVKGISYFIEAMPQIVRTIPNIQLLLVGAGSQTSILEKQTNDLKINKYVTMHGPVDNRYMPEFYALSDLVVIPSLEEGMSITGLEAMSSGKPLIGTEVGGIPELIDEGKNGFLVPPKNSVKLAEAVIAMFKNPKLMIDMGKYSRNKAVKQFSWEKIAKETLKIYEQCCSN